jgi:type I restriction enzyme, S subunit
LSISNHRKTLLLGEVASFISGGTPNRQTDRYWNGNIPWFSAKDLKSFFLLDSLEKVTPEGARSGTRLVEQGTILILVRGMTLMKDVPLGITCRRVAFNQDLKAIVPKDGIDGEYLGYYLSSQKHRLLSFVDQAGHGTGRLATEYLADLPIEIPPLKEQKAIAKIVNAWDSGIGLLEKLLAAKTRRKRGLMQQLLMGRKRFAEFEGQTWKRHRIADLLAEVRRYEVWHERALYNLVSIRRRCGGLFFRGRFHGHQIKVKKLKSIKAGDFLISKRQVVHGAWGMVKPEFDGMKVSDEYDCLIVREPETLAVEFFDCLAQMPLLQRYARSACNGVHIEKLIFDFEDFSKEYILVPPSVEEQRRIAAVLTACNQEIELLTRQLAALKRQKQGLMQQLMTGRVRVKVDEAADVEAVGAGD